MTTSHRFTLGLLRVAGPTAATIGGAALTLGAPAEDLIRLALFLLASGIVSLLLA